MVDFQSLAGVYAAALTPLAADFSIDYDAVLVYLDFLAGRGCHGALLLGTTGEGPSFAPDERIALMRAATIVRERHPDFRLLFGTGTPSLEETVALTKAAFDLGMDGVVVLPPYYFRKVSDDGLFAWFSQVIRRSVPRAGAFLGYHFPTVSGVSLSIDLLARLVDAHPNQFAGLKDSSGDLEHARQLGEKFGGDLIVFNGSDNLFSHALEWNASGCITALANLCSPTSRLVWDAWQRGEKDARAQARLDAARAVVGKYPPAPPLLKALLAKRYNFPHWPVSPPLLELPITLQEQAAAELEAACHD